MGNDNENENVEILVTEFESLRSEIRWLVANGMRYLQFAMFIAVAGLSASTYTISQSAKPYLQPSLGFAVCTVLSRLGILCSWEHVEIHVVARLPATCGAR